jgi:ATP-dependent helicase/nuclease subunit A
VSATQLDLFATPELADQAARDDAVHRIDTSFVVSAGAGAGKTETLIRRLEQVLAHGGDPSRIVAITFTERAARDLVNKLRAKLPTSMTAAVEQMTVGTIHSFCLGILRRHPLEAGLPPVFSTQDELLAGTDVRDRALRIRHRMFERVQALDDPALREALDVLVAENGIGHIDALIGLVDQQWDRFDELDPAVPAPWQAACHQALARVRELAHDREVPLKLRVLIQDLLPGVDACLAAPTMAAARAAVPSTTGLRSTGGADGKPARDEVKACIAAVKGIVHDCAVRHLAHLLVPIVLEEAHGRYQSGSLSFDDILVLTRRLLTQQPALCRRIRAEIDHLCVDEFQDTDVVQYDIVQALTAPAEPSTA